MDPHTDPVHAHDQEAECDGCMCDIDMQDAEVTPDGELPTAAGGLHPSPNRFDGEDDVDGCDVEFAAAMTTADDELPAATGGGA